MDQPLHICLISVEIFAWGKYGGFGRATRMIGGELVKRGVQVSAITPQRGDQKDIENLDGIRVLSFNYQNPSEMLRIFRDCDADIFHSQEPSMGTYLARKAHPDKKHIVTFRDTRLLSDWIIEFKYPSRSRAQVIMNLLYEDNFLVHHAVRKADMCFSAAQILKKKAMKKYRLGVSPDFLPTPVEVPKIVKKSKIPTVCYIARWDRRKRPEFLIELVKSFPDVRFIIAGTGRDYQYTQKIQEQLAVFPNVELKGFVNQFETGKISDILSQSWVLINFAAREGLPNSFIEAGAHRCAILSSVDPDGFASQYGYYAAKDDFSQGLKYLLLNENWKKRGLAGFEFVSTTFSKDVAIDKHMDIYNRLLQKD